MTIRKFLHQRITFIFFLIFLLKAAYQLNASVERSVLHIPFQNDLDIKIAPNPALDMIKVNTSLVYKSFVIYNIIGKPLIQINASPDHMYNINNLPGGIYLVRFYDQNDQVIKTVKLYKKE